MACGEGEAGEGEDDEPGHALVGRYGHSDFYGAVRLEVSGHASFIGGMNPPLRYVALGAAVLGVAACSAEKKDVDTVRDTTATVTIPAPGPDVAPTPAPPADQSVSSWKVTDFGIGPLRAGMTAREGIAVLQGAGVTVTPDSGKGCHYLKWGGPPGVRVMVDEGVIARVEVDSASIATAEGARVGDAETQIKTLYPGRVTVQPHKYTNGHYLVVKPVAPTDSEFRIVFETDGKSVTKYRAGKQPQVSYVEGCS